MRRFLLLILLFVSAPSYAQWNVGIKGGANLSWINYDARFDQSLIEQDRILGYMGGLSFQYFNQPNIGIQFETLYIQKGFKTKLDTITNIQYQRNIDYLSFPFLMHAYIGKRRFNISFLLGPYISYAISSNEIFTEGDTSFEQKYVFNRDIDNRFEFGLQGGIGFRNTFNFGIIAIQGTFSYSLTSIYKWGVVNADPDKDRFFPIPEQTQNQGVQITLSYYRSFGKVPERKKSD
jgi:hypothetical protein